MIPGSIRSRWLALAAVCVAAALVLIRGGASDAPAVPSAVPPASPDGMVYIPGGVTRIGSHDGPPEERPVIATRVQAFFMDVHPVTVAQFRAFVDATGHLTDAERVGDGGVYDVATGEWTLVAGATWRLPLGRDEPPASDSHPVTQVSWHDASAYARWAGKRLPAEVEWEHAARGARDRSRPYAWGHSLLEGGAHRANTWQGPPPLALRQAGVAVGGSTSEDGYLYTSPVGVFGETELGLTDMGGNVWEWTSDWFAPYGADPGTVSASGEKVQRGGSFLCHERFCHGYRVSARSRSTPDTALFHVGFRCVQDIL